MDGNIQAKEEAYAPHCARVLCACIDSCFRVNELGANRNLYDHGTGHRASSDRPARSHRAMTIVRRANAYAYGMDCWMNPVGPDSAKETLGVWVAG